MHAWYLYQVTVLVNNESAFHISHLRLSLPMLSSQMATELLHCCICPKLSDFSDTSHLLTHVSSKGHLSHLHKLQVRSHQEIGAGHQLAAYNEWYSKHDIAQLLSERMQHKERKQAKKRADNKRRCRKARQSISIVDPSLLPSSPQKSTRNADVCMTKPLVHGRPFNHDDTEYTSWYSREVCRTQDPHIPSTSNVHRTDETVEHGATQVHPYSRSEIAGLKGTIWPGMDMFDSADHETQRKRNQRKDGSVLERMRMMSSLIEPTETVYSPRGTMKKSRHIDEIEDDSPIEGEEILVKHPLRRKRKPLSTVDANLNYTVARSARDKPTTYECATTPLRGNPIAGYTLPRGRTSPNRNEPISTLLGYPISSQCKHNAFPGFGSGFSDYGNATSANRFLNPLLEGTRIYKQQSPSTLLSPVWNGPTAYTDNGYDPFKDYREAQLMHPELGEERENPNPLTWDRDYKTFSPLPAMTAFESFDDFDGAVGSLAHVYAFTKNSLMDPDAMRPGQILQPMTPQAKDDQTLDSKLQ